MNIVVSGAAGMIANHLLFKLASGEVFGPDQPIALKLLGSQRSREALEGVAMELEDSLYPLLREVSIGIDPYKVFQDAEWALLIGAKPRGPGMERAALLDVNGQIFAVADMVILYKFSWMVQNARVRKLWSIISMIGLALFVSFHPKSLFV